MRPAHRRRTVAAIAAAILLGSLATSPATARPAAAPIEGSWIVTLAPGVDASTEAAALAQANGGSAGFVFRSALNGFQFSGSSAAADALRRNPNVTGVYPDHAITLTETLPYGVKRIDGSYSNVVGLPVAELYALCTEAGILVS